jgi:predicted ester cyclase
MRRLDTTSVSITTTCARTSRSTSPEETPVVRFDAYLALVESTYVALEDYHVTVLDRFATDDRPACRWTNAGIHVGELNGRAATGKKLEWSGVSLWELENGTILTDRGAFDRCYHGGTIDS